MHPIRKPIREITEGLLDYTSAMHKGKGVRLNEEALAIRNHIVIALGFLEEIAMAIRTGTANEEKLRRYYGPLMINIFDSLKKWIECERETDNEPAYYIELEAVVKDWKDYRTKSAQFSSDNDCESHIPPSINHGPSLDSITLIVLVRPAGLEPARPCGQWFV